MSEYDYNFDDNPYSLCTIDEVLIHIEYDESLQTADAVVAAVQTAFSNFAEQHADFFQEVDPESRMATALDDLAEKTDAYLAEQPDSNGEATSLIPPNVPQVTFYQLAESTGEFAAGATLRLRLDVSDLEDPSKLKAILAMYRLATATDNFTSERVALKAITPNWLQTAGGTHATWGGPGALPAAPTNLGDLSGMSVTDDNAPFGFQLLEPLQAQTLAPTPREQTRFERFSLESILNFFERLLSRFSERSALEKLSDVLANRADASVEPVTVYVLDTAPARETLKDAYDRLHESNPLLGSLLAPNGHLPANRFNVTYYDEFAPDGGRLADLQAAQDGYEILRHEYDASDHGLFVAGIIHTLAPYATIELVQVLNDKGVGSTETIENGLRYILDHAAADDGCIVINASLLLAVPSVRWLLEQVEAQYPEHPFIRNIEYIQQLSESLMNILPGGTVAEKVTTFEEVHYRNVHEPIRTMQGRGYRMIAAAGNDGINGLNPPARYPAAFAEVDGVGAIDEAGTPTIYSNLSDRPTSEGLATIGGMVDNSAGQTEPFFADADKGLLGLFLADYPQKQADGTLDPTTTLPNDNGFARWAGTSFATPIVTGLLALLCAHGYSLPDAMQLLDDAYSEANADMGEQVLVKQG